MRCPAHPEEIATNCCAVCGSWHCVLCAPFETVLDAPVCPSCRPSLESVPSPGGRGKPGRIVASAVLLLLLVIAVVLYPQSRNGGDAEIDALLQTYQQLERVGLALQRFHQEHGDYPGSLSELVPQHLASLPEDPFVRGSGGLKYLGGLARGQRRLLYSVGPDGVDQGGLSMDPITGRGDMVYPVD